jgi:hypothetical protein
MFFACRTSPVAFTSDFVSMDEAHRLSALRTLLDSRVPSISDEQLKLLVGQDLDGLEVLEVATKEDLLRAGVTVGSAVQISNAFNKGAAAR